jgi:hypothetical protein
MSGVPVRLCVACVIAWLASQVVLAQPAAIPPEWEIQKTLAVLVERTERLTPLLDGAKPEDWIAKGAPQAYVGQWKSVREEIGHAVGAARELQKGPDRLSLALEVYFRLQSVDALLVSLGEGIERYQNPALADLIRGAMSEGAANREVLRQYIVQLAALKEEQLKIADQEAQRCRTRMLQQAPPRNRGGRP